MSIFRYAVMFVGWVAAILLAVIYGCIIYAHLIIYKFVYPEVQCWTPYINIGQTHIYLLLILVILFIGVVILIGLITGADKCPPDISGAMDNMAIKQPLLRNPGELLFMITTPSFSRKPYIVDEKTGIAMSAGPDGQPGTQDDIKLGDWPLK